MKKLLEQMAGQLDIALSEKQLEQFQIYYDVLLETNKVMNLTAITEMREVVQKHFVDSIAVIKYIDFSGKSVIDVGTGAGFPGIPLAIMLPETYFVLMDSLNKRIKFLNEVIQMCGLSNAKTVHSRAEDLGRDMKYREKFDICLSRAVANMSTLLEYCIPFVKKDGMFVSYKSGLVSNELIQSEKAQKELNCLVKNQVSFQLPESDFGRTFIVFQKKAPLNKKYPRQAGKPKREPL